MKEISTPSPYFEEASSIGLSEALARTLSQERGKS